jgi:hypothetical protein
MGEVELNGTAATRLEVDKQQPARGAEHVPWVRLTVQQLLGGATVADRSSQAPQPVAEEFPVLPSKRRSVVVGRDELLRLCDSIREVRGCDIELPHAGMEPRERVRVVVR